VKRERSPSIVDVASLAGVHPGTVSRALSHPERVAPETRVRIEAAIKELRFVPNRAARGLKVGRTGNVAVIVPDITNPHFAALVRAVEHAARRAALQVLLVDTGEQPRLEVEAARSLTNEVDGFIVLSPRRLHRELEALGTKPPVFVNRPVSGYASVLLRTAPAINEALRHLASLGHTSLAYLRGPSGSWATAERREAVRRTSRATGTRLVELPGSAPTFEAAAELVDGIVASGVTAVMAFNDQMALGVLAGLAQRGISVPHDVSIVGCDDVPMAAMVAPSLTTVGMPIERAGETAVSLLNDGSPSIDLFATFVPRGSTGPVTATPATGVGAGGPRTSGASPG
jgi:LacI family transcriptional regulator